MQEAYIDINQTLALDEHDDHNIFSISIGAVHFSNENLHVNNQQYHTYLQQTLSFQFDSSCYLLMMMLLMKTVWGECA